MLQACEVASLEWLCGLLRARLHGRGAGPHERALVLGPVRADEDLERRVPRGSLSGGRFGRALENSSPRPVLGVVKKI